MVVRRPSIAIFAFTRSSIELTFCSPIGQPKAKPGCSKPFLVAQPATSAVAASADRIHVVFISGSPFGRVHIKAPGQQSKVYHRVAPRNVDAHPLVSAVRLHVD